MEKQDYYALVNYRGKTKYYHVGAHETHENGKIDIRIEYLDYNENRESSAVWIFNGIERIVEKFDSTTDVYKYFNSVGEFIKKRFEEEYQKRYDKSEDKSLPDIFYTRIGTSHVKAIYKEAFKKIPNPLNIKL
jgi:hypothetical protein